MMMMLYLDHGKLITCLINFFSEILNMLLILLSEEAFSQIKIMV